MGIQEEGNRKRARRTNLRRAVLDVVKAAGLLSIVLVAPNTLQALKKLGILDMERRRESIRLTRLRLIRQGYLSVHGEGLVLTGKGEAELRRIGGYGQRNIHSKWDGKWRVLIFDIPNHKRGLRDRLRQSLKSNGFERLQDSVWVYPHNCEDFVALLKSDLRIGKEMQYLVVDSIENDTSLRRIFGLPRTH